MSKIFNEDLRLTIDNTVYQASNLSLTLGQKVARLTADAAAASGTITVDNYLGFSDDDYLLLGNWGEPTAEIVQVNDASIDSTITLQSNTVNDHYADTPVTVIPYNQVQFFRSTTDVDANSDASSLTQLGSDVNIMAYRKETIYVDETNTTGYIYIRFKNGTFFSEYSDGVDVAGNAYNSMDEIAKEACNIVGVEVGSEHAKEEQLIRDANECKNLILKKQDWVFELEEDLTSLSITTNVHRYALSGLTTPMKYPDSKQGILNLWLGSTPLKFQDIIEMERNYEDVKQTTVASAITANDTSITLTNTYELAEAGTIYIGSDTITYTANAESTGVLTGCSGVDSNHSVGAYVWQSISPGRPEHYSVFNGNIHLDRPPESDLANYPIKIKYLKQIARFTGFNDVTEIPFDDAIAYYLAYKIEKRRENTQESLIHKSAFEEIVQINMKAYAMPTLEENEYYDFGFESTGRRDRSDNIQ